MASLRAVKRSRVSYDDSDPRGSAELVSASLGMFTASEHTGLFADVCHLAESIVWGRGEHGMESNLRRVVWQSTSPNQAVELFSSPTEPTTWQSADGTLSVENFIGTLVPPETTFEATGGGDLNSSTFSYNPDPLPFKSANFNLGGDSAKIILDLLPPICLQNRGVSYTFDRPVVGSSPDGDSTNIFSGLMCSALGRDSPVLRVENLGAANGSWPLLCDHKLDWGALFVKFIRAETTRTGDGTNYFLSKARCSNADDKIALIENREGGGRAFASAYLESVRRGTESADVSMRVLWGAVSGDFWLRALNQRMPWSADNLGSLMADEGVSGRLLGVGASVPDSPFCLADFEAAINSMEDMDVETNPNYELVALSSYRFMRDPSVAYPATIISFDGGTSGWAIEMFDSVAVNALELAYFMLGSRFQL